MKGINYNHATAHRTARAWMPWLRRYFRFRLSGTAYLPDEPFLMVGNHSGGTMSIDAALLAGAYIQLDRLPRLVFLAHESFELLAPFSFGNLLAESGLVIASPALARQALDRGFGVMVYPGGERENCRPYADRKIVHFYGHLGYARLALERRVPVVPVCSVGSHESLYIFSDGSEIVDRLGLRKLLGFSTLPIALTLPWGLTVGPLPFIPAPAQITTEILPPIDPVQFLEPDGSVSMLGIHQLDGLVQRRLREASDRLHEGRLPIVGKLAWKS